MLLSEIDPIGDMQGVISLVSDIPALQLSRKFNFKFSEHMYFTKDEVAEYLYVPISMRKDFETMLFLNEIKAVEEEGLLIAKISSRDYPEMDEFRKLIEIPSVVIDYKLLDKGVHRTYFSFHHSHLREVSEFLFNARKRIENLMLDYIGASRGLAWLIEAAVSTEPLYHVEASLDVPKTEISRADQVFNGNWIRRPRYTSGDEEADALYRMRDDGHSGVSAIFQTISQDDAIYRARGGSALSRYYSKTLVENFDPLICQYQRYENGTLLMGGVVSKSYFKTILGILSETSERFPEWNIKLMFAHQLSNETELRRIFGHM